MNTQIISNQIWFAYFFLSGPNQKNHFALGHSVDNLFRDFVTNLLSNCLIKNVLSCSLCVFMKKNSASQIFKHFDKPRVKVTPCWSVHDFGKINLEKSVQQTGFLVYFELDFYCLCSLEKSIKTFMEIQDSGLFFW